MTEFDFSDKPVVVKADQIPKQTRTRIGAPNPLAGHFDASIKKEDENGVGQWLSIPNMPAHDRSDKAPYGEKAKYAFRKLTDAAKDAGKGLDKIYQDNEDGTVTLFYRSNVRRTKAAKDTASE